MWFVITPLVVLFYTKVVGFCVLFVYVDFYGNFGCSYLFDW